MVKTVNKLLDGCNCADTLHLFDFTCFFKRSSALSLWKSGASRVVANFFKYVSKHKIDRNDNARLLTVVLLYYIKSTICTMQVCGDKLLQQLNLTTKLQRRLTASGSEVTWFCFVAFGSTRNITFPIENNGVPTSKRPRVTQDSHVRYRTLKLR